MAKIIQDSTDIIRELQPNSVDLQLKLSNNVKNKFDYIDNIIPHEDAEGTSVSMDKTVEYRIKTNKVEGDTQQITTTGKNIFASSVGSSSSGGLTIYKNSDGSFTLNGTNSSSTTWFYRLRDDFTLPAGTYTLSNSNENVSNTNGAIFYDDNSNFDRENISTKTFTNSVTIKPYIKVTSGASFSNFTIYPMIEEGSDYTGYETYTGQKVGPNSSYPQNIEVVKGTNILKLTDGTYTNNGITAVVKNEEIEITGTASGTSLMDIRLINTIPSDIGLLTKSLNPTGTYTGVQTSLRASDTNTLVGLYSNNGENATGTLSSTAYWLRIQINSGISANCLLKVQVEKGTQASKFYPGKTIGINVRSKNLLKNISTSNIINGITFTRHDDGSITAKGTASANAMIYLSGSSSYTESIDAGTYTISGVTGGGGNTYKLEIALNSIDSTGRRYFSSVNGDATFQIQDSGHTYTSYFIIYSGATVNTTIYPMLVLGSVSGDYEPYSKQSYPLTIGDIELCKIGDYQDCFKKSTGINIFDEIYESGTINGTTGASEADANIIRTKNYQDIESGREYSMILPDDVTGIVVYFYSDGVYKGYKQPSLSNHKTTFMTRLDSNQIRWRFNTGYTTMVNRTLLVKGSSVGEYEPHGKGTWYLHKEIGKVILNGSETNWSDWNNKTNTIGLRLSNVLSLINISSTDTSNVVMSNYFIKANSQDALYSQDIERIATTSSDLYFRINKTTASSLANFKTWLSTHNLIVYYALATPTNTVVTDETLLQQLQDLDNANSYGDVTYLTTSGNLPPIVDITYFQDIKKLITS